MNAPREHVDERIDAWLDGRLEPGHAEIVEEHLAECPRCRRLAAALEATRTAVRAAVPDEPVPEGLRGRIGAALDELDRELDPKPELSAVRPSRRARPGRPVAWRWLALAATVILAVGVAWLGLRNRPAPPDAVPGPGPVQENLVLAIFRSSAAVRGGPLPSSLAATDAAVIEGRWQRAGVAFPARVLDLAAMGVEVVGGDAPTVAGRLTARSVYRSADGVLVCWMFLEELAALAEPSEVREHGGFRFQIYRRGGETAVFWQEGDVVCGLVGSGDPEGIIALAFAKAMAPAPPSARS